VNERDQIELERAAQAFVDAFWLYATNLDPYFTMLRIRGIKDPVITRLMLPEKASGS
jgi:hypothetical protein